MVEGNIGAWAQVVTFLEKGLIPFMFFEPVFTLGNENNGPCEDE